MTFTGYDTPNGQITIPSRLREEFGLKKGTKSMAGPTDHGLVLKKIDPPSVEAFQKRVTKRTGSVELSMEDVDQLAHDARSADE